jgi:hypothetical protein
MQTQSFPVGIWLLLGLISGFGIGLGLQFLRLPEINKSDRSERTTSHRQPPKSTSTNYNPPRNYPKTPQTDDDSDWDAEPPPKSEDWDFEDEEFPQTRTSQDSEPNYEDKPEPTTKNVSGSVYSYSYRQPQNTGAGQSEAIREANYRVINPPYREPPSGTPVDEDDWGFDFDDEESDRR